MSWMNKNYVLAKNFQIITLKLMVELSLNPI